MKQHIAKKGDTLSSISALYYSNPSLYMRIFKANSFLQGRSTGDLANEDLIYPGEKLIIPTFSNQSSSKIVTETGDLQIEVNGVIYQGWSGITIDFSLDQIANTFSFSVAYDAIETDSFPFKKFGYESLRIFYKGKLKLTGTVIRLQIVSGDDSTAINIGGYSKTGILTKANLSPAQYPSKFDGQSMVQIATQICDSFGISVVVSDSAAEQANIIYDEIGIGKTEKIAGFLLKMAKDRSCVLSPTITGDLYIDRIIKGGNSVLDIIKPNNPERKNTVVYDGDKLHSDYYLVSSGDETNDAETSVFRFPIKSNRPVVITQSETSEQNSSNKIENAAKKALADAYQFTSSVIGWEDKRGNMLKPGDVYTVKDPSLQIDSTERHIVKNISYTTAASGGRQAAFTGVLEAAMVAA